MQNIPEPAGNKTWWFKSKAFRITIVVLAVIAVAAVVLFSKQIGELLDSFGVGAATEDRYILVDGDGDNIDPSHRYFLGSGYESDPEDAFWVDPSTDRLMLNPPADNQ